MYKNKIGKSVLIYIPKVRNEYIISWVNVQTDYTQQL